MGYCSGMAFRRVGRALGVVIGVGFMGVQAAAASGYIDVDWNKVKDDAIKPFDTVRHAIWKRDGNVGIAWETSNLTIIIVILKP